MFGDMFQLQYERKIVRLGDQHWIICHVLHMNQGELDDSRHPKFALAVKCDRAGAVNALPAPVELVRFFDRDIR